MTIDRSTPQLGSLYQQLILDHYKSPKNKGELPGANAEAHLHNPTCGDEIHLRLLLDDGVIRDARFEGHGCSISQAAASMMTQLLRGKSTAEALSLVERFKAVMHGDPEAARDKALGELRALAGVSKFPVRVKCALLSFNALEESLR